MDAAARSLVRHRADNRCEYCLLPQEHSLKRFPLHELLKESSPRESTTAYLRFSGNDIGVNMDRFAYFALSLVWRCAITEWPLPNGRVTTRMSLIKRSDS